MVSPQLDEVGRLIGDGSRAAMLLALMDGRAWTGRELAAAAHVTPSTASEHLQRLVDASFLNVVRQGKHRYYRIASHEIAGALEAIMAIAPPRAQTHPPAAHRLHADLRRARTCYDHLAGELGVAISDALIRSRFLTSSENGAALTHAGEEFFQKLGISVERNHNRRPLCRACLDWTERRYHLGGRLGAALAAHAFEQGWLRRCENSRALAVTGAGVANLRRVFGVEWNPE